MTQGSNLKSAFEIPTHPSLCLGPTRALIQLCDQLGTICDMGVLNASIGIYMCEGAFTPLR